jgi:hypothetical protein
MNRKTLTALGVLAVLSLIAFFALRSPEKGERRGERPRPIAKLKTGDFDTIEVSRAKLTTVIHKEGGKFKVVSPTPYPADENAAKQAFDALEKLEFGDVVTDQKAKQLEFEVDEANGLHVVAKNGNLVVADLMVGKALGAGTMVRPTGKDEVWQANGSIRFNFDKPPADWRDKSITTFAPADVEAVHVKSRTGGAITLKKAAAKDGTKTPPAGADLWTVADSSVTIPKLDDSVPASLVSTMSSWKTNDFADDVKPEQAGLADPALTVTVTLKGGKAVGVLVGNKKSEDDFYVKSADAPQIFLVKKYSIEHVNKRPIDFRDKTLCDISDADLNEVAVSHGADSYTLAKSGSGGAATWKAIKPAKTELDATKVPPITGAFKAWKATGFAEDPSPKATGLAKPRATILAKSKGATCTVKIGDESKDKQSAFVQLGGAPDVYTVAKWSIDRVLVKVSDIKKATVAKQ